MQSGIVNPLFVLNDGLWSINGAVISIRKNEIQIDPAQAMNVESIDLTISNAKKTLEAKSISDNEINKARSQLISICNHSAPTELQKANALQELAKMSLYKYSLSKWAESWQRHLLAAYQCYRSALEHNPYLIIDWNTITNNLNDNELLSLKNFVFLRFGNTI